MKTQQETVVEFANGAELERELVSLMQTTLRLEYELELAVSFQAN